MTGIGKNRWLQYLVLYFGILCISWSAIFVKLSGVPGLSSAFYRMLIGSFGILPLWFFRQRSIKDWGSVKIAALCGLFFACDIALWNTSILLSKASISTLLANLAPVWVGLGAILILKEKPRKIFWLGTMVAMLGVMVIVGVDQVIYSKLSMGNLLAICASIFYGAYLLTTKMGRVSLDTVSFTGISMVTSTIILFIFCKLKGVTLTGYEPKTWIVLVGLGLISQLGGWLSINYALGYIKPTVASVSLLSQSVFTAIFSIPVLGEFLNWKEVAGALIVLAGIYMVNGRASKTQNFIEPEY
jgi:drug/metabolite transporter (DMT)-like permease